MVDLPDSTVFYVVNQPLNHNHSGIYVHIKTLWLSIAMFTVGATIKTA